MRKRLCCLFVLCSLFTTGCIFDFAYQDTEESVEVHIEDDTGATAGSE